MQLLSLIWGIIAVSGMLVGFVPCLGALNWLNIPFSGIGIVVSAVALGTTTEPNKGQGIAGLVCCIVALFFGIFRLVIGGGVV